MKLNKLNKSDDHDITHERYYFYSYFNAYLKAAAINDQIDNLHLEQAIDKITSKPIDAHFLARVITYFYILKSSDKLSMSYIRKAYKERFYPEAEKTLLSKFKIQFKAPKINTDFFKPKPNKTYEKNTLNPPHTTQLNEINKTLSDPSINPNDNVIMSDSNTNQETIDTNKVITDTNLILNDKTTTLLSTTSYNPFQ